MGCANKMNAKDAIQCPILDVTSAVPLPIHPPFLFPTSSV